MMRIADFADVKGGKRLPAGTTLIDHKTNHPYLRIVDFKNGRIDKSQLMYVPDDVFPKISRYTISAEDIYISIVGTVGLVGRIDPALDGASLTENAAKICNIAEYVDQTYLAAYLQSTSGQRQIAAQTVGSTQPKLALFRIADIQVPVPPIAEQQAIASVLGALDDKIEQNRRTAQALEKLARAIFRAWFVDFEPVKAKAAGAASFPSMPQRVFDALPTRLVDSDIGPVPEGWVVKAIGDVVTVKGGATPSTKDAEFWDGGTHCWATPKDMSRLAHPVLLDTERRITDAGVERISSGVLPVGTVLMSSRAPVGYLAIAGVPTAINQGFIAMVCDGPLPPTFVFNWAACSMDTIKAHASGTTFAEISKRTFRPLPIVEPTPDVTVAYRELAEPLFESLTACVKESAKLAQMRDYLLPKLLSGQVRVRAAARSAATVA